MVRFSQRHLRPDKLFEDSERLRVRLGASLGSFDLKVGESIELRGFLTRRLGVRVRGDLEKLFDDWQLRDVLDAVTLLHSFFEELDRHRGASGDRRNAIIWLRNCQTIFAEEFVCYRVDDVAEVHFAVDEDFARDQTSTLLGLDLPRYRSARREYEQAARALREVPPNGKAAIRGVFIAVETLFKLMFVRAPRLGKAEVDTHLKPVLARMYAGDPSANRSMEKTARGFIEWVDAAHFYRHAQGEEEPSEPPLEATVLLISQGSAFLRWLISVDAGGLAGSAEEARAAS